MVGLHVRSVFDAPRDVQDGATAKTALNKEALRTAQREYGAEGVRRVGLGLGLGLGLGVRQLLLERWP